MKFHTSLAQRVAWAMTGLVMLAIGLMAAIVFVVHALDGKLYVVYDVAHHEKLTRDFGLFLAGTALLSMFLAFVLSRRVARRIVSPLQLLTDRLTQWAPGTPNFPVSRFDEAGRLMEAFNRVQDELDDSIAREREFAANLHHEIRTPLSRIRSDSELMLRRHALDDADSRRLRRIMRSVDDITESLEVTYDIAHAEKGLLEPVSLSNCVDDTFDRLEQEAKSTGLVMENQVDPAQTGVLNRYALLTVMRNLARNAAKHAAPATLVVRSISNGLAFVDSGPGIAPEELPFIFDRYYSKPPVDETQGDPASCAQDRQDKAGLGLAIARRICATHDWSITLRSPAGVDSKAGAAFHLTFPGRNMIPNTLVTAFQTAHYVVFTVDKTLVLRTGQHSPAVARLFSQYGVTSAAIFTAYNPNAKTADEQANRRAQDQLRQRMNASGFTWLEGENRAESDDGPCEPTVVVLGITREQSEQLAQELGQLAFVYVDASCQPELAWVQQS